MGVLSSGGSSSPPRLRRSPSISESAAISAVCVSIAIFAVGQERVVALERLYRPLRLRAEFPVRPAIRQSVAQG